MWWYLAASPRAGLWDTLQDWIKWAYSWVVSLLSELAGRIVERILDFLPESMQFQWGWLGELAYIINGWLPMAEFFTALLALWTFQLALAAVRFALKMIPGVG